MEYYSQKFNSKKQLIDIDPKYSISLDFSNNLLQTFIIDIFEKLNLEIDIENIMFKSEKILNMLKIFYKEEHIFLQFFDAKFLTESIINKYFFKYIDIFTNITNSTNIIFFFFDIKSRDFKEIHELIFFLNSFYKIKTFECYSNIDIYEYLENFLSSIKGKEEKGKLTYFDIKPVTNINLSDLDDISDITRIWVKHLMCIPGISENKAISIVKKYPNFKSLMEVYESEEFTETEKQKFLRDIEVVNSDKKARKRIGDVVSSKIYKYYNSKEFQ